MLTFGMENIYGSEKLNLSMEEVGAGSKSIRNCFGDINKRRGGHFHRLLPLTLHCPRLEG